MERLSGLDASFLYLETPNLHMHVSMAAVFDPATVPGGYTFERLRDRVSARLDRLPVFRRRLVEVPLRLGHPFWVEDPDFDIEYHVRRAALPSPGGVAELATFVGDVCSRQLDRARPLWQMYLVEGLERGLVAHVTKIHHATIDGVSGAELLGQIFDLEPDPDDSLSAGAEPTRATAGGAAPAGGRGDGAEPGGGGAEPGGGGAATAGVERRAGPAAGRRVPPVPDDVVVLGRTLVDRLRRPLGASRLALHTGRAVIDLVRVRRAAPHPAARGALPLTAPRTSLNGAITPHRTVALVSTSLDDVKAVKRALGCTVNDVVLAMCTGALRHYLVERDDLPTDPLVALVPVSVEPSRAQQMQGSNKVSAMWVGLPCALADPVAQVEHIRASTRGAKDEFRALGADVLVNWTEHASPSLFAAAARLYSRLRLADRHRPIYNVVVSNVPGPDFPLYLAGAEMVAGFPLGPVADGAGLNITVMSYRGVLNWGLMACTETVPGVWDIAHGLADALHGLMAAAGLGVPAPVGISPAGDGSLAGGSTARRAATRRAGGVPARGANRRRQEPQTAVPPQGSLP